MTADNEVTTVFEKYTIKQIEDHLIKTRNDIERKKEDLRIMVGERYRDLIEAADSITEMQCSAEAVCNNIQTMEALCESLQQRGLIGFKTRVGISQPFPETRRLTENSYKYSIAVQVKLLVDVPEILWSLAERKEYLAATQLLLLSQHAHTALQLSQNAKEVIEYFPVILQQWSNIAQFKSTIVKGCSNLIKFEINDNKAVLCSVASMMLLENYSMEEALNKVLDLRKNSLNLSLVPKSSMVAKDQLIQFVILFISSLVIVKDLFVVIESGENSICLLEDKLKDVCGVNGDKDEILKPISLLDESTIALSFLPQSVTNFRPKLKRNYRTLDIKSIKENVASWAKTVSTEAITSVAKLLSCVTSIKSLSMIRNNIWETQVSNIATDNWPEVVKTLQYDARPWHSTIRYQVLERAKVLIKNELDSTKLYLIKMVRDLVADIKDNYKTCQEEGIITHFVWNEALSDIPTQVGWSFATKRNVISSMEKAGLFYKSKGYTKRIQNICKAISLRLNQLLDDLFHYAPNFLREISQKGFTDNGKNNIEDETALEDYNSLLAYLEKETLDTFQQSLEELNHIVKENSVVLMNSEDYEWENDINSQTPESTVMVATSRLSHAFTVICPQLRICASATLLGNQDTARRVNLGLQSETESWQKLKDSCITLSTSLVNMFLDTVTSSITTILKQNYFELLQNNKAEDCLLLFSTWQTISIEEEDENKQIINSDILIPAYPSPSLIEAFFKVCSTLNSVCAHTIIRTSQMALSNNLLRQLVCVFECLDPSLEAINQKIALQLIFDLKVISRLFITKNNKDVSNTISFLVSRMESKVDPFDLNVFHPHLESAVKMAAAKLQTLLGIILPKEKQPINVKIPAMTTSANNSLPVISSVEVPRFSNVPLPVSYSRSRKMVTQGSDIDDILMSDTLMKSSPKEICSGERMTQSLSSTSDAAISASRSAASLISSWFGGTSS